MRDQPTAVNHLFEDALASVPLTAAPVTRIRRGVRRATAIRRTAVAAVITVAAVFTPFASTIREPVFGTGIAVAAQVRALLFPTNPAHVFVLGKQSVVYDRVASLTEARKVLPFRPLVPTSPNWQLRTVLVSKAPALVMLYRLPNQTWAQVSERPRGRVASAGERNIGMLIAQEESASKATVRPLTKVVSRQRAFTTDLLQITVITAGPDANSALGETLIPL
jgi:hypothetical protein